MSLSSHQSMRSVSCDWLTPPDWLGQLGEFDLDPCASIGQPWATAKSMLTEAGLHTKWHGFVWLNPPYGPPKVIEPWMARMAEHDHGIALIPARTDTQCWHKYVWNCADSILFVQGRPHFHLPITGERSKANSGAPIALIAYEQLATARLRECQIDGKLISLRTP